MPEEVRSYLAREEVGVLAVELLDGAPHAATVHVAFAEGPVLLFLTDRTSRKSQAFSERTDVRASFVLGTADDSMQTLQLDGIARQTQDPAHIDAYFARFPKKRETWNGPNAQFLVLTPTWWRYTTYEGGKRVVTSA